VPQGAERAERIMNRRVATPAGDPQVQTAVTFRNDRDQRTWYIGSYHLQTHEMRKLQIEWTLEDGTRHQWNAERGFRTNDQWVFETVQEVTMPGGTAASMDASLWPPPQRWPERAMPELTETPRLIESEIKISRLDSIKTARKAHLSLGDITDFLALHSAAERHRDLLLTTYHSRLAAPWTCVVVVLISLPFGAASGRRNVFVGVASSVFICFAYYVVSELSLAFGGRASVPPWLAAWLPNLLFGLAGIVMTQRTR
jgi:lipopolysaccharide export LptBFGC system permease protein LptF